MADDNKNNDFENELDDEFDFEADEELEDVSLESSEIGLNEETEGSDSEELEQNEADEAPVSTPRRKSSVFPTLIGMAIVGFVGYQLYNFFGFHLKADPSRSEQATLKPSTPSISKPAPSLSEQDPSLSVDSLEAKITQTPQEVETTLEQKEPEPERKLARLPSWDEKPQVMEQKTIPQNGSTLSIETISQQVPQPPVQASMDPKVIEKIETQLGSLHEAHQKQIAQLERGLTQTVQNTNNLTKGVQTLQLQIEALSKSVQQLSSQINQISLESQKAPAPRESKPERTRDTKTGVRIEGHLSYSVYAIIPGRAWLRAANGNTLTVSEGDQLGEYGKVLKIDPSNGIVVTSSGVTLR